MANAYNGKLLRINLTDSTIKTEALDIDTAKKFIGGRGLGTKMLYDEGVAKVDPMSPDNKLAFMTGPLTGAAVPTGTRYMVVTKSPLTGMIASSNSGGIWGAKLKYAGWDAIIVEGKAKSPVRIHINDDKVEILPADEYWGMTSLEVEDALKEKYEGASVLNIGPAGETLSLIAAIMNEGDRAAGRSGVGAVMGSKNLKAISVVASRGKIEVADADKLAEVNKECMALIKADANTGAGLPALGTAVLVNVINSIGSFPTKNWQEAQFDKAEETSGEMLAEKYLVRNGHCHRCPIGCGRVVEREGREVGGPEYEVLWAYGGDCGVSDMPSIIEANFWCNELGLDAISAPSTVAAAMELYQRGLITDDDCEGVPLEWGNNEAIVEWTKRMGRGETALGKLMAQGSYRLCDHYGMPELSMSVKKQEMPAYDGRSIQGMGLEYATSNRGGCHVRGATVAVEVLGAESPTDRFKPEGKGGLVKMMQDMTSIIDSSGLCLFTVYAIGPQQYADLLNAASGTNYTAESVMEAGERVYNIERLFNKAAGQVQQDDTLPPRLLKEPVPAGPAKGEVNKLDVSLPEYYALRGWVDGFPTDETLKRLDLL